MKVGTWRSRVYAACLAAGAGGWLAGCEDSLDGSGRSAVLRLAPCALRLLFSPKKYPAYRAPGDLAEHLRHQSYGTHLQVLDLVQQKNQSY